MRVLPILFNTPMTQSVLAGNKTQTRRLLNPQPIDPIYEGMYYDDKGVFYGWRESGSNLLLTARPAYQQGDALYVRETWCKVPGLPPYLYKASCHDGSTRKWRPSIHMPREAARIFLRVTDVRVERLQDSFNAPITPILAVQAEGIDIGDTCRECLETYICPCCVEALDDDGTTLGECGMLDENRGEFSDLWDSTIKKRDLPRLGWTANPWIWVYEFERISKEEAYNELD